jgi:integrase
LQVLSQANQDNLTALREAQDTRAKLDAIMARLMATPEQDRDFAVAQWVELDNLRAAPAPVKTTTTIRQQVDKFISLQTHLAPLSVKVVKMTLYRLPGDTDASTVDEEFVENYFIGLRGAAENKKKDWMWFKKFVRFLWSKRVIDLPRNLDAYKIGTELKAVKTWDLAEVRSLVARLKGRLRAAVLLGLNCGMTSVDVAGLTKDMVDLDKGTLTRRRVKTGKVSNVPTVTYRLWAETIEALRACESSHPTLWFVADNGNALWTITTTGRVDTLGNAWRHQGYPIPLKAFRSISATALEQHDTHCRFSAHFLGHSVKTMKEKHYAPLSAAQDSFDSALMWLRERILG